MYLIDDRTNNGKMPNALVYAIELYAMLKYIRIL